MRAIKKPVEVYVRGPLLAREVVQTPRGFDVANAGDFVLADLETGTEEPITALEFAHTYDITDPTIDQEQHSAHNLAEFGIIKREEVLGQGTNRNAG
jgi:hypothetical protein